MTKHRNQHFVPRCYLRAFSRDEEGNAINLFHIARRKSVQDASVKGQCARPYFYGRDLEIERAFQGMEGEYARVFKTVSTGEARTGEGEWQSLREFILLQLSRTAAAISRTKLIVSGVQDLIHAEDPVGIPRPHFATHAMMVMTLDLHVKMREVLTDLKVCILKTPLARISLRRTTPLSHPTCSMQRSCRRLTLGMDRPVLFFSYRCRPAFSCCAMTGMSTASPKNVVELYRSRGIGMSTPAMSFSTITQRTQFTSRIGSNGIKSKMN